MAQVKENNYLKGKLLLSMPTMSDPRFFKSVIYICNHDDQGAMGLNINNRMPGFNFKQLLAQLNIKDDPEYKEQLEQIDVMNGGPVETARGFVLHSNDFIKEDTIRIDDKLAVTGTIDAIKEIASGNGPKDMIFMLGYAGWSEGQLDEEIRQNAWLIAEADYDLVFNTTADEKWEKAIAKLGINPNMLSGEAGRA